jgi:hypothetical protein
MMNVCGVASSGLLCSLPSLDPRCVWFGRCKGLGCGERFDLEKQRGIDPDHVLSQPAERVNFSEGLWRDFGQDTFAVEKDEPRAKWFIGFEIGVAGGGANA